MTDSGQVRLLDFGVAKLLAGEQAEPTAGQLTGLYGRALTPDYASPELLRGDAVDARSDIYSLGILLHELLSGARPHHSKPGHLSERIDPVAAEARGMSMRSLKRALRGDLDAITLKALAIEPDGRYDDAAGTAHGLLAIMRIAAWQNQIGDSTAYLDEAYKLARRAVELDDSESTCHSLLAQVYMYRRAFEPALKQMQRAVELNPNNQWNLADMAFVLGYAGDAEQALIWSDRA